MNKKVLIIDDEVDLCMLLQFYLKAKHYDVEIANTLESGLLKLSAIHPDLIFLDNNLPDGLGWEKKEAILKDNPELTLALMSGRSGSVDQVDDNGRVFILQKPFSLQSIDRIIH